MNMKGKILNLLLILTSLLGYLEWGGGNSAFLFQAEYEVLKGLFSNLELLTHPLTFIPLFGQVLLIITLFQQEPSKKLTYIGMACLGLLLGLMFLLGAFVLSFKVLLSTVPFFITVVFVVRNFRE